MGSPLGPVLAGLFMVELENTLVTALSNHLMSWKRYVDDTSCFLKEDSIEHVMSVLNGFYPFIQFTCETESKNRHHFQMYSLFVKDKLLRLAFTGNLQTFMFTGTFCIKPAETQHSKKFSLSCSYLICSDNQYFALELKYLRKVFKKYNNYPHWFIVQVFNNVDKLFDQ